MNEILSQLGFSQYKKKAYLALISLRKASVHQISKKANIPSSKLYEVLSGLYEEGYISLVSQKPIIYVANDPKAVLGSEVKNKLQSLQNLKNKIDSLNLGVGVVQEGKFQITYGRESFFKKVKEAVSKSNQNIVAIVKSFRIDHDLKKLTKQFMDKGGAVKFLGPIDKNSLFIDAWKEIGVKIKNFIPEGTRFTVWDSKIIAIGFKDSKEKDYFSIWIENEFLGKILVDYFNKLWAKN